MVPRWKARVWLTHLHKDAGHPPALSVEIVDLTVPVAVKRSSSNLNGSELLRWIERVEVQSVTRPAIAEILRAIATASDECIAVGHSLTSRWFEVGAELVGDEVQWASRWFYTGGRVYLGDSLLPIGGIGPSIPESLAAFQRNHQRLVRFDATPSGTSRISHVERVFELDAHSSGIFLHEVVGHACEADNKLNVPSTVDLMLEDVPISEFGPRYIYDDAGTAGSGLHLEGNSHLRVLSAASGNSFVGGVSASAGCEWMIRQRNLVARSHGSMATNQAARIRIVNAGVSSRSGDLKLAVKGPQGTLIAVSIPFKAILLIQGQNGEPFAFATICVKGQSSHVVGVSAPPLLVRLKRPLHEYLAPAPQRTRGSG